MRNSSPLGLIFASNRTIDYYGHGCPARDEQAKWINRPAGDRGGVRKSFIDEDVWVAHSMMHAALSIYVKLGSTSDALAVATKVMNSYRVTMADQEDAGPQTFALFYLM